MKSCLVLLGPTILGIKPGELINVPMNIDWQRYKEYLKNSAKFDFIEVKKLTRIARIQIYFYNKKNLEVTLFNKANHAFLISLGYPREKNLTAYLNLLVDKMRNNTFPHEIGIFVGYPLKDVLGFMGKSSLKLVKVQGWRYYGDQTLSEKYYCRYQWARHYFSYLLYGLGKKEI